MNQEKLIVTTPLRIAQLSDIHLFADTDHSLLGVNTEESFKAILKLLKNNPVDLMLLTGDLSQDGSESSYQRLADQLNAFEVPIYFVPGNHDNIGVMSNIYPIKNFSSRKQIVLDHWQIILLDSQIPGSVEGYLDLIQLKFLETCLQTHPDKHAIIVFHHHPIQLGSAWLDKIGLLNAAVLWELLTRYPQANTVLFGHVHHEYEGSQKGIKYFSAPSTCIQFKKMSETFILEKLPPGYRWLDCYPNGTLETGVYRVTDYIGEFNETGEDY